MDIIPDQNSDQEIFENTDIDMDKSQEMELESEEMEDTRPVQEILSELAQQARNSLNTYNNAVTRLENILKNIDESKEIHIKVCGIKRKFYEFIEECALESRERLKKENAVNFGQLLLKGLGEDKLM